MLPTVFIPGLPGRNSDPADLRWGPGICIFGGHSIGDSDGRGSRAVLKNEAVVPFDCTTPLPNILSGTPPPDCLPSKVHRGCEKIHTAWEYMDF